jgi:oligoribonuclease (3'-5' exoribonuclease)
MTAPLKPGVTPYNVPRFGLAIDWETSGYSVPEYAKFHQGISVGVIIFDCQSLDPIESLYLEIKFDEKKYKWDPGAERVHGLSREHLRTAGIPQEEAATVLCNLIVKYIGTDDVMLLGHRVHFDRAFTEQLTKSIGVDLSYHPNTIDSCSMAIALMEMAKSEDVFQTLGMPPRQEHNALEDIMYTLLSVKRMKDLFFKGIEAEISS